MAVFMLALSLAVILIHVAVMKQRTAAKIVEVILMYRLAARQSVSI